MNKIILLTDSTCDLGIDLLKERNIKQIPLYVNINGVAYKDQVDLTNSKMYSLAESTSSHPKTSTSSQKETYDFLMEYLKQDYDVIYCGIGKDLSSQYNNVYLASNIIYEKHNEYINKIHLIDSKNLSTGIGILLLKIQDYIDQGKKIEEVIEYAKTIRDKIHSTFCVENLDYIHKGGRCSNSVKFIGNLLQIKPILKVIDGKLSVVKKSIGPFKKALNMMIHDFLELYPTLDKDYVIITHSEGLNNALYVKAQLEDKLKEFKNVLIKDAGCVISSHCGKNTTGIMYLEK